MTPKEQKELEKVVKEITWAIEKQDRHHGDLYSAHVHMIAARGIVERLISRNVRRKAARKGTE